MPIIQASCSIKFRSIVNCNVRVYPFASKIVVNAILSCTLEKYIPVDFVIATLSTSSTFDCVPNFRFGGKASLPPFSVEFQDVYCKPRVIPAVYEKLKLTSADITGSNASLSCTGVMKKSYPGVRLDATSVSINNDVTEVTITHDYFSPCVRDDIGPFREPYYVGTPTSAPQVVKEGQKVDLSGFQIVDDAKTLISSPLNGSFEVLKSTAKYTKLKLTSPDPLLSYPLVTLGYITSLVSPLIAVTDLTYKRKTILSVNLETLDIPWEPDTDYTFEIEEGFVEDKESSGFQNLPATISYVTNPPLSIVSSIPPNGALETDVNDYFKLSFGRDIIPYFPGNFYVYQVGESSDTLIKTIPVNKFIIEYDTLILDVRGLITPGNTYYITSDRDTLIDEDNFMFFGLTTDSELRFTTTIEPWFKDLIIIQTSFGTLNASARAFRSTSASMFSYATLTANAIETPENASAYIQAIASLSASGTKTKGPASASISSKFTISAQTKIINNVNVVMSSAFTISNVSLTKTYWPTYQIMNPNGQPIFENNAFGHSVSVNGDYGAVGCVTQFGDYENGSGKVYMYNLTTGQLLYTKTNPNINAISVEDRYGWRLDTSSTKMIVSADIEDQSSTNTEAGAAYVYNKTTGALLYQFFNPNSNNTDYNDAFGNGVSLSENYIIVGAPFEEVGAITNAGVIYVYDASNGSLLYNIPSPLGNPYRNFGNNICAEENYLIVGVSTTQSASWNIIASIFDLTTGTLVRSLIKPPEYTTSASVSFFYNKLITISGDNIALSMQDKKVHIYSLSTGNLLRSITCAANITSIDLEGNALVVGCDDSPNAYLYDITSGDLSAVFPDPIITIPTNYGLGYSVSISGTTVMISSITEDTSTDNDQGYVYVYKNVSL